VNDQTLRILLTDPHLRGGGQVRYVVNLAAQLRAMGHRVVLGCKPGSVLREHARQIGCEPLTLRLRGGLRPASWQHDIQAVRRLMHELQPHVLHASGSSDHWTVALANALSGGPVCVVRTRHNTYRVHDAWPNRVLNRRWTDFQIVVCDIVRRDLARQRAFDAGRMRSIHNGVDAEAFRPDPAARSRVRAEFGYAEDDMVCGIVARLVPAKGHRFLFEALPALLSVCPRFRVLALGQGDEEPALRAQVEGLGVAHAVRFAGFRDDMAGCVQALDIGVQPSIDCDTSSFSLKEQMAAEKPVVASEYGGLPEIIDDGVEGFLVPAGESAPLVAPLARLASDPGLRARMGAAGRARVERDFTVQTFAARTLEAYRQAIAIHAARRSGAKP
jgi:glycosyltransferase involved in cell wall biosynthesis